MNPKILTKDTHQFFKSHDPHDIQEIRRRPKAKLTTGQNVVGQLHPEIIRETKKHSRSEGSIFQLTGNKAVVSPNLNNTFPVGRSAKVGRRTQTASGPHYRSPTEHQSADLRSSPGDGQWQNTGVEKLSEKYSLELTVALARLITVARNQCNFMDMGQDRD